MNRAGGLALCTALLLPATSLLLGSGARAGAPAATEVSYWGTMFSAPQSVTQLNPTALSFPQPVIQVGTSNSTSYALLKNGAVMAWGIGNDGQLGDGGTSNSSTPLQVDFPPGVSIAALATDAMPYDAALAIDTNGNVWGWGNAASGALCLGMGSSVANVLTPTELPGISKVTLAAGASAHAIFDSNGSLYACGWYQDGALGTGTTADALTPQPIVGMSNVNAVSLVASSVNSGVLLADGDYYDWGSNAEGQLGDGSPLSSTSDVPVKVPLPLPVTAVTQGGSLTTNGSTLVRLSDGSYRSWGDDQYGELGDGETSNQASPIEFYPPAGVSYSLVDASGGTSYGVTSTGAVYAWGQGNRGQIGNGGDVNQMSPVEVVTSGAGMISATAQDVVVGYPGAPSTATTYYVSPSGATPPCSSAANNPGAPFSSIQAALNCAAGDATSPADPDLIEIASGTYAENDTIGANVNLEGSGAGTTVVDGTASGPVMTVGSADTVGVSGVTIEDGSSGTAGGIYNAGGSVTASEVTFSGDSGGDGGAVYNYLGSLWAVNDTFTANTTSTAGGGISNDAGSVTAGGDLFSDNSGAGGGGIWTAGGTVSASDDTFVGNAAGNYGGGLEAGLGGTLTATDDTFSANSAASGDGGAVGNYDDSGTLILANSILDDNSGGNCGSTISDDGYNISYPSSDTSCPVSFASGDPDLGPLQDNGGPSETMAITPASAAFELVSAANCAVTTDERGDPRPGIPGQNCDAGAFEYQAPVITSAATADFVAAQSGSFTVATASGDGGVPSLGEGGALPTGVSFTDNGDGTATLSGTPAMGTEGTYLITLTARDPDGVSVSQAFSLTVTGPPSAPTSASASAGSRRAIVSWTDPSSDGGYPITGYTVYEGASPGGESYASPACRAGASARTCTVTGLKMGTAYYFTVEAVNAAGSSPPSDEASAVAISPLSMPRAKVGKRYAETLSAVGGSRPYSWTVAAGGLPRGLSLSTSGAISGTPTTAGTFTFTVKVADSASPANSATQAYSLTVAT